MKITEYDRVSELHPNDLIIIDGDRGTKVIPVSVFAKMRSGKVISYEEYLALPEEERASGDFYVPDWPGHLDEVDISDDVNGLKDIVGTGSVPAELGITITGALENIPFKFGINDDGDYGYIKRGADSVTPFKTGVNIIKLGETTGYTTYDVKSYKGYEKFSSSNFFVVPVSISVTSGRETAGTNWTASDPDHHATSAIGEGWGGNASGSGPSISYNANTGIVSITPMSFSVTWGGVYIRMQGSYGNDTSGVVGIPLYIGGRFAIYLVY